MRKFQQGDVLVKEIASLPHDLIVMSSQDGRYVLAHGESGHMHAIEQIEDCCVYEKDGMMYMCVDNDVELQHEEHHSQTIAPGLYEIGIVQEYDYFTEMSRRVVD